MSHEKYLVEGVILESRDYGESGKILNILTKDSGVVSVLAVGVREITSKMRGSLDVLEQVNFEYVEGKEINRLVGIFPIKNLYPINYSGKDLLRIRKIISNVVNFVLRTVVGQVKNENLWDSFLSGFGEVEKYRKRDNFYASLEIIWIIKILTALGYWENGKYDQFSEENYQALENEDFRKIIVEEINQSIESTHL